jgi:hypothetical protein
MTIGKSVNHVPGHLSTMYPGCTHRTAQQWIGADRVRPSARTGRPLQLSIMCVEIYAVPAERGKVSARILSEHSGLTVTKARSGSGAFCFSRDKGCGCSLLGQDADWRQPMWKLEPEVLESLAKALELLDREAGGLTFQAIWMGDRPETESRTPLKDLVKAVRANEIRNKHVYKCGRAS